MAGPAHLWIEHIALEIFDRGIDVSVWVPSRSASSVLTDSMAEYTLQSNGRAMKKAGSTHLLDGSCSSISSLGNASSREIASFSRDTSRSSSEELSSALI